MKKPVVLITGASQGIGEAIAQVFAEEVRGVQLALVARNEKKLKTVARACAKRAGGGAAAVTERFGAVDVLINNAGAFAMAPFLETSVAEFDRMVATNLRSAFLVTRALVPAMVKRKRGDVFFMSSIAGLEAYPQSAAYCAAKFGVTGLAKVVRAETKAVGVRVCCVHPGATWSPSWSASGVAPERLMPAAEVARAVLEVYRLTRTTVVEEIVLRPQLGDL